MSTAFHPNLLTDYSARTWITGEALFPSILNKEYKAIQNKISQLNKAVKDTNNRHAGTTAPTTKIAGQIVFDDSAKIWYGDPDGLGADDEIATRLTAYKHSLATAGTDTFKVRGLIESNTTAVTRSDEGTLIAYTLPANTLDSNGQSLRITAYGTAVAGSNKTIHARFGTVPTALFVLFDSVLGLTAAVWFATFTVMRTSASTIVAGCKSFSDIENDSASATKLSPTIDFTAAQTISVYVAAITAPDTITQEGMLIELLD